MKRCSVTCATYQQVDAARFSVLSRGSSRQRRIGVKEEGQGLLEFALLLPVLILIIFGVLDLGRAFFAQIALTNAARVGARSYAFNKAMTVTQVQDATRNELRNYGLDPLQVTVAVSCTGTPAAPPDCASEQTLRVTASYPFQLTMTFLFSGSINMSRSIEMMTP